MKADSKARLRAVVQGACRAPSVHNTQPWRWRIAGWSLELYADRSRQLRLADPDGRNLVLSCGAALDHAVEMAHCLGLTSVVEVMPVPSEPDLLAVVRLTPGPVPLDAADRLATLRSRCTDRRRFTAWPVPDARLHGLAEAVSGSGAYAVPLTEVTTRMRTELLLDQARRIQSSDPRFAEEQAQWIEHSSVDGLPAPTAAPSRSRRAERPNRFADDEPASAGRIVESSDGLMALCTAYDDQKSWIDAGRALSKVWLQATRAGLSIVPLSQPIEVPETRRALLHEVFADLANPLLLLRVGWQEIGRTTLPRTPRRPLDEVLVD